MTREHRRLLEARDRRAHWKRWGPYLSERAWGTVREDYSPDGTAWSYFPHDHARSRAYRWNEDGLGGFCDRHQHICFAVALWNERDPILKERLFGLTGAEGNRGEDVKELYFYLDSTPTHSIFRYLYKYPQRAFPYADLVSNNAGRSRREPEYELLDTGIFDENEYFDVSIEYAKADVEDICIRITATNRASRPAPLHVLPTIWFRNTWSWNSGVTAPSLRDAQATGMPGSASVIALEGTPYGSRWLHCAGGAELLFTENETNLERLYNVPRDGRYFKDGIHDAVVGRQLDRVNPARAGTKASAWYHAEVPAGGTLDVRLRFTDKSPESGQVAVTGARFDRIFADRRREADEFYGTVIPGHVSDDGRLVMRQALAGLLWSKQFYHYAVKEWLEGDPGLPSPPASRLDGRNRDWVHLHNADVIAVPDKWEYPWYASWDLAFHCVALALVDPDFAKEQLLLFLREWFQHPNGQLPAYEWALSDVNPPVHAWAVWRVYKIEKRQRGVGDRLFLERAFHKLLLNFTWWLNRKDADGNNLFEGGFLGLDNVGVFDRNTVPAGGGRIQQSDATSWVAMYSLNLFAIAVELARFDPAYEDVASKFWEHFLYIAHAVNHGGRGGPGLWDETDGFFYDVLGFPDGRYRPMKVRSIVSLIPLCAVETLEPEVLGRLAGLSRRMEWFIANRPDLTTGIAAMDVPGRGERRLLSLVTPDRLIRVLRVMLDETEFLSEYGIRSLSKRHAETPYQFELDGVEHRVSYEPEGSLSGIFGGNSNWRGPIWFPVNFLLIESLQRYFHYFGDQVKVECPTHSGRLLDLGEVASELSRRLSRLFLRDQATRRAVFQGGSPFQQDPHWRDLVLFHEFFHGDTGVGLGASHQTGWTALVAKLIQQSGTG